MVKHKVYRGINLGGKARLSYINFGIRTKSNLSSFQQLKPNLMYISPMLTQPNSTIKEQTNQLRHYSSSYLTRSWTSPNQNQSIPYTHFTHMNFSSPKKFPSSQQKSPLLLPNLWLQSVPNSRLQDPPPKKKKKESRKTLLCFLSFELWQWSLDGWMRCFLVVYCLCDVENFHERFEVDTSLDRIREHISL